MSWFVCRYSCEERKKELDLQYSVHVDLEGLLIPNTKAFRLFSEKINGQASTFGSR